MGEARNGIEVGEEGTVAVMFGNVSRAKGSRFAFVYRENGAVVAEEHFEVLGCEKHPDLRVRRTR